MTELEDLLAGAARKFEPEIQRRLGGLLGGFIRAYLPQAWVFRTDRGSATLRVDAAGHVRVASDVDAHPDATIDVPFAVLDRSFRTGTPPPAGQGGATVTAHTAKGRAAIDYLRPRLGF